MSSCSSASRPGIETASLVELPDAVGAVVASAVLGANHLGPLLVVCLVAGSVWARLTARAASRAGLDTGATDAIPLPALWLIVGLNLAGWLAVLWLFSGFGGGVD